MRATSDSRSDGAVWTVAGLGHGIALALPGVPAMAVFGLAFGAAAVQHGLTLAHATLMSALVFAGASQFVAVEMWVRPITLPAVAAIALMTAIVNLRLLLMAASLRPWLGVLPVRHTYPALALLTDPGWLLATRYRSEGGNDAAAFLASGVALWFAWIAGTAFGHVLGGHVADLERVGLDLVMPCFFAAMLVPLWQGLRAMLPWLVAGAVALLTAELSSGWWFIVSGALAGSAVVGLCRDCR